MKLSQYHVAMNIMNRGLSLLSIVALLLQPFLSIAHADQPARKNKPVALQGEERDHPQDLSSRLDDGKLRILVDSMGIPSTVNADKSSYIVRLIGEGNTNIQVAVDDTGVAEFDNVTPDKMYAVVVNTPTTHATVPILPVSDKVADAKGIKSEQIRIPVIQASSQEILKNIATYTNSGSGQSTQTGTTFGPSDFSNTLAPVYAIELSSDGTLKGRVIVPESNLESRLRFANLTLLNSGVPMSQTTSNEATGNFSFANVLPGSYGLIAAGPAGYAAYEIEVIAAKQAITQNASSSQRLVSANQASSLAIVVLVPPSLMPGVVGAIENYYGAPVLVAGSPMAPGAGPMAPGGGFPGGGFGGGGGMGGGGGLFGGGGGLGGLAVLGALAGVAAAIASDDNNNNNNGPVVVSPISQ